MQTNKGVSDEAGDAAALTYLLTYLLCCSVLLPVCAVCCRAVACRAVCVLWCPFPPCRHAQNHTVTMFIYLTLCYPASVSESVEHVVDESVHVGPCLAAVPCVRVLLLLPLPLVFPPLAPCRCESGF